MSAKGNVRLKGHFAPSKATGYPQTSLVTEALGTSGQLRVDMSFLKLAGSISGPPGLSKRKGFSRE